MALKPKWIVGVIIGALMIYLSIFGLSGILYALVNPVFTDHFTSDTSAQWFVADAEPVWDTTGIGTIAMAAPTTTVQENGIHRTINQMASASVATCEISIKWTTVGGYFRFLNVLGVRIFAFVWENNQIQGYGSGGSFPYKIADFTPTVNVWYKFTVQLDKTAGTMKVYKDNVAYATTGYYYDSTGGYNILVGVAQHEWGLGTVVMDYLQVAVDKQEPSGPGTTNPSTGTLKIYTYHTSSAGVDTAYPSATFHVTGPNSLSADWQSDSAGSYTYDNAPAGSYSFTGTGMTGNSGTVTVGASTTVYLKWPEGTNPPPPTGDWWAQIVAAIQQILNDGMFKTASLWGGVLVVIASLLMFVNVGSLMKTGKSYPNYRSHRQ